VDRVEHEDDKNGVISRPSDHATAEYPPRPRVWVSDPSLAHPTFSNGEKIAYVTGFFGDIPSIWVMDLRHAGRGSGGCANIGLAVTQPQSRTRVPENPPSGALR
jgi:hypothetical protein